MVNIKYCHLEVCSVLQRSLRVKPCAKEVCGPNKALTTHAIPMKTVAFVTEELGGKRFFFPCVPKHQWKSLPLCMQTCPKVENVLHRGMGPSPKNSPVLLRTQTQASLSNDDLVPCCIGS